MKLSRVIALTGSPRGTDNTITGNVQSVQREDEHQKLSDRVFDRGNASKNKSNWKSIAYSSTKMVLDVVKESSDAFPLKAAAGSLVAVLKHCDVWLSL